MPYYDYTAKNIDGKVFKGKILAENETQFYAQLRQEGLFCIKKRERAKRDKNNNKKLKIRELVILSRQFATMLNSGISIVKCIDILYEQAEKKYTKSVLLDIYKNIQQGNTLSAAIRTQGDIFPSFFTSMIEVGEQTGSLDCAFGKMALHYEKEKEIKDKTTNAMIYPIILGSVSVIVIWVLLVYVVPNFFSMFEEYVEILPWSTRFLLGVSQFTVKNGWAILVIFILSIGMTFILAQAKKFKQTMDYLKLHLPIIGKLNRIILSARFAETLSTLYSSGLSLIDGIEISQRVINNSTLDEGFIKVKEDIAKGIPLSVAMKSVDIFPSMLSHMVQIGEESGQLDEILEKTSKFYEQEADRAIKKLISLVEPTLIIILGIIIGFIIASILPPMYSMYQNIQ